VSGRLVPMSGSSVGSNKKDVSSGPDSRPQQPHPEHPVLTLETGYPQYTGDSQHRAGCHEG